MKTIGQLLKEARRKKKYSRKKLEKITKIKKSFIENLESENWTELPEYTVVVGFVKNIANTLGIDNKTAIAFLRRDYPNNLKEDINPKPDLGKRFSWSPRLTFFLGVGLILLSTLGYLIFQYFDFIAEPTLEIYKPKQGEVVYERQIEVSGKTDEDVSIVVNNQPVLTDENGNFTTEIEVFEGTENIEIEAISRSGRRSVVVINISPELKEP